MTLGPRVTVVQLTRDLDSLKEHKHLSFDLVYIHRTWRILWVDFKGLSIRYSISEHYMHLKSCNWRRPSTSSAHYLNVCESCIQYSQTFGLLLLLIPLRINSWSSALCSFHQLLVCYTLMRSFITSQFQESQQKHFSPLSHNHKLNSRNKLNSRYQVMYQKCTLTYFIMQSSIRWE